MKDNGLRIIIRKPIEEVFEFTTNPNNTHKWIKSITEEKSDNYPAKIGTIYRNSNKGSDIWNKYEVIELENNKLFTLKSDDGNYYVKYTYKSINKETTELTYFEWVEKGELKNPFTEEVLKGLKYVMEIERI